MNLDRLRLMRSAARVQRYHTAPTIYRQSVGEHTFGAIAILLEVWDGDEGLDRLIHALMQHDTPEVVTGDAPAPAKRMYSELEHGLRVAEAGVAADYDLPLYDGLSDEELKLLKFCDRLELVIFCIEEFDMGNRHAATMARNMMKAMKDAGYQDINVNTHHLINVVEHDMLIKFEGLGEVSTWHGEGARWRMPTIGK